jgi:hypothetical protein
VNAKESALCLGAGELRGTARVIAVSARVVRVGECILDEGDW